MQTKLTVQYFIARLRLVYNGSPFFDCLLFHAPTEKKSYINVTIAGEELQNLGPITISEILKFLQCIIAISLFDPVEKWRGPSFAHYPWTHCANFGWNWYDGSGEENNNV